MAAPVDYLTVLTTLGPLATKRVSAQPHGPPKIEGYGRAARFSIRAVPVSSFDEMVGVLLPLQRQPRSFVVRGEPAPGVDRRNTLRRLHDRKRPNGSIEMATVLPAARYPVLIDVDGLDCPAHIDPMFDVDELVEHVVEQLPEEFHGASCFWWLTSSHGFKPGICIRLAFWSDRALTDDELKAWLADSPVDRSIYNPLQAIYTAAPVFVGLPDPVPYRSGIWHGYCDYVSPPEVVEQPKRIVNGHASGSAGTLLGNGSGYEGYRAQIGDGEGLSGFYGPLKAAIGAFVGSAGVAADIGWLRADLERAIHDAPRDRAVHDDGYVDQRIADLDGWIGWTLDREREKPQPPPLAPTYAAPLGSVAEARRVIAATLKRWADVAVAWEPPGEGEVAVPPVHALNAAIGTGKTRALREHAIPVLIAAGKPVVLAVPRHRLGDEIVRDLAEAGIVARVYRGREALDPDDPDGLERMCREGARVQEIEAALGNASAHACKNGEAECASFQVCGYQRQRKQKPDVWIVPHQLLFRQRPAFIKCGALAIDESFHDAALHGVGKPILMRAEALLGDRKNARDTNPTHDLVAISRRVHALLVGLPEGRLSRRALLDEGLSASEAGKAYTAEWRRKLDLNVRPGMDAKQVKAECARVAAHNQQVARLGRFWQLLKWSLEAPDALSPWLELRHEVDEDGKVTITVAMAWHDEIHDSWHVPTMILDATMPVEIVRQFFSRMEEPVRAAASMPFARVRQITDRAMSAAMLIETAGASARTNATRHNNVERVRRYIEVRSADVWPGRVLVVAQQGLEEALRAGALPENVELAHFNAITGLNTWAGVALLIVIGRPEPSPRAVERITRALFGADIAEIPADEKGEVRYPVVTRVIRMRDGSGRRTPGNQHPDPRAEAVRWAICEAEVIQAIGRGRGVNRTAANPLQIDILTNVCLPIEVDEVTTWDRIQPGVAQVMAARGAVPMSYRDMAAAYPDLFPSAGGAEQALRRQNPLRTSIRELIIGVCRGFLSIGYRRTGSRGPAKRLLYDARRHNPEAWLTERLGPVTMLEEAEEERAKDAAE